MPPPLSAESSTEWASPQSAGSPSLAADVTSYVFPLFAVPLPMIGSHFFARTAGFAAGAAAGAVTVGEVAVGVVAAGVVSATVVLLSSPPVAISTITTTTAASSPPAASERPTERRRPGRRLGVVASAFAASAVLAGALGSASAAAQVRAFAPDFGAVLRALAAVARDFERLLGLFGVAIPTHYSAGIRVERRSGIHWACASPRDG